MALNWTPLLSRQAESHHSDVDYFPITPQHVTQHIFHVRKFLTSTFKPYNSLRSSSGVEELNLMESLPRSVGVVITAQRESVWSGMVHTYRRDGHVDVIA